ncbi:MAG: 7-cyano-7-deazaguanine synthase QueC [Chloroflexota bacterium]
MGKKAVVLLSGGVDSSTTMAIARSEGYEIYAISFDYAQRHRVELEAAGNVARHLGARKHLLMSFDMGEIGGSALTTDTEVPKTDAGDSDLPTLPLRPDVIPVTYVPARNTVFLSFALSWAETIEAPHLFIGANAVDYSGYPDCRPEYLRAFETMANLATRVSVEGRIRFEIRAPLLFMTKAEIIRKGTALGLDYSLTWSCYDPQLLGTDVGPARYRPCGRCDSCLFRAKGFAEAGLNDPLISRDPASW